MNNPTNEASDELKERERIIATMLPYRLVKFVNGEDVIAQLVLTINIPDMVMLRFPFRIIIDDAMDEEPSRFALLPLIPFTDQEVVGFNKISVMSICSVAEPIKQIYIQQVFSYIAEVEGHAESSSADATPEPAEEAQDKGDGKKRSKPSKRHGWLN